MGKTINQKRPAVTKNGETVTRKSYVKDTKNNLSDNMKGLKSILGKEIKVSPKKKKTFWEKVKACCGIKGE